MSSIETWNDEEFDKYSSMWKNRLIEIELPTDTNSSQGQVILYKLDKAYSYLRMDLAKLESVKDGAETIIRQAERSHAIGKNEYDRKKNATDYLQNYNSGDVIVNMYDYASILTSRYIIIKGLVDVINNKQQRLITMSGFMKIDSTFTNNH